VRLDRLLEQDEQVLLVVRPHGRALLLPVLWLVLLLGAAGFLLAELAPEPPARALAGGVLLVLLLVLSVAPWLRWRGTQLVVTDARLLLRSGVVRPVLRDVLLDEVVDVATERGPLDRLLGSGTLVLSTEADDEPLVLPAVPRVAALQRTVWELVEQADERG